MLFYAWLSPSLAVGMLGVLMLMIYPLTLLGGRVTASVFAFNNAVAGIGFIVAPVLFGYLAQHYGWTAVFVAVAITYILCAASWLAIDCTIPMIEDA